MWCAQYNIIATEVGAILQLVLTQVRVHSGASEVSVVYRVDEFSIELSVCLPDNYPLQPPSIREGRRARVDAAQWRKWMLQLSVFIANQVGPQQGIECLVYAPAVNICEVGRFRMFSCIFR